MHLNKFLSMRRRLVLLAILSLTLVGGACRRSPPPEVRTAPASPNATESNLKTAEPTAEQKPLLTGRIENVSMYPVPNKREDLAISLVVSVKNAGIPSTAQGWSLEVSSPARNTPTTLAPVHVNGLVEMPGSAGKKVDLGKEDLVLKTAQLAIPKGDRVSGILTFVLPKSTESELANNNTILIVHFKDSQGHAFPTAAVKVGAKAGSGK